MTQDKQNDKKIDHKLIRAELELVFEKYRQHKYYTLFITDYDVSVTSKIDEVGGGRSNNISDNTADVAIKLVDKKSEAKKYVEKIEKAVEQLPDIERELIEHRYMCKNYHYINDYTVYEVKMHISANTYRTIRKRALEKLYTMLIDK